MTPYYEQDGITIYHGDCREVLPQLPTVDLLLTDPPYGIEYVSNRRPSGPTQAIAGDDAPPHDVISGAASLLVDGGAAYVATRFDVAWPWVEALGAAGLTMKTPIFWDKQNHTAGDLEGDFGAQVEILLFAHKGRHKLRGKRWANLWSIARPPAQEHPTPKPVGLMSRCIEASSDPDDLVMDPFMGSGTTLVAAKVCGRRAIGIDINERYCEIAANRLAQGVLFGGAA